MKMSVPPMALQASKMEESLFSDSPNHLVMMRSTGMYTSGTSVRDAMMRAVSVLPVPARGPEEDEMLGRCWGREDYHDDMTRRASLVVVVVVMYDDVIAWADLAAPRRARPWAGWTRSARVCSARSPHTCVATTSG
jgi:hypothetical protein